MCKLTEVYAALKKAKDIQHTSKERGAAAVVPLKPMNN
jgi:hypothetical protein